jgi:hypothetical protein
VIHQWSAESTDLAGSKSADHYDGVPSNVPAVIALFGIAPVGLQLVDPSKPAWHNV